MTISRQTDTKHQDSGQCECCVKLKEETIIANKNDFVFFMVEIINCSVQSKSRNERIKIIIKSAEKHLGVKGLDWETEAF